MTQTDGHTPRLPDHEPGRPTDVETRPSYHEALRAAHQVHAVRMADGGRRHRVSFASAGGFLVFAGLVAGLVAASHAVWSGEHRSENADNTVGTEMFSVMLPSTPVRTDSPEVMLGTLTQLTTWTATTVDVVLTVLTIDTDLIFPGEATDPARAAAMLEGVQQGVVTDIARGSRGTTNPTVGLELRGRHALQNVVTADGAVTSVTTAMHGSTVVSVVCKGAASALPAECQAVLDSLVFR